MAAAAASINFRGIVFTGEIHGCGCSHKFHREFSTGEDTSVTPLVAATTPPRRLLCQVRRHVRGSIWGPCPGDGRCPQKS